LKFEFDGKILHHQLRNTLYVPEGGNCLLSLGRYDDTGGKVEFENGTCWLKDKSKNIVGKGYKHQKLYLLAARAILSGGE